MEKLLAPQAKRPLSKLERLCIERAILDYDEGHKRGLVWDEKAAIETVAFFERGLVHWKSVHAGKPFILTPWWQRDLIIAPLFGWKRENGTRRFRELWCEVPRGNGKSPLGGGIGAYMTIADGEEGSEVYSVATTRDQAHIIFDYARFMVEGSETIQALGVVKTNRHAMTCLSTNSRFIPLASEAGPLQGKQSHCVLVDETHAHKDSEIYDVMKTSMAKRPQPLLANLTTAGTDITSFGGELHENACSILKGIEVKDDVLAYIATIDDEDDWASPEAWWKANPNLGISVQQDTLAEQCEQAKQIPSFQNTFLRYYCNRWVHQDEQWIPLPVWDKCEDKSIREEMFYGQPCFCGLDLSSTTDLTADARCYALGDDKFALFCDAWVPAEGLLERERRDKVPYMAWIREGWMKTTPGRSILHSALRADIVRIAAACGAEMHAYDPWSAAGLVQQLEGEDGLPMIAFRQGTISYSGPCKEFFAALVDGRIVHNGNPVLRWNVDCVALQIDKRSSVEMCKPVKAPGAGKRIDCVMACIMAFALAKANAWNSSVISSLPFSV